MSNHDLVNSVQLTNIDFLEKVLSKNGFAKIDFIKNLDHFWTITERLGWKYRRYTGSGVDRSGYKGRDTIMNVNSPGDNSASSLHGEQYYLAGPPNFVIFFCQQDAEIGGNTILCDGVELFKKMDKEIAKMFLNNDIIYQRIFSSDNWKKLTDQAGGIPKQWEIEKSFNGDITTLFRTSAIRNSPNGEIAFINSILPFVYDFDVNEMNMAVHFANGEVIDKTIADKVTETSEELLQSIKLKKNECIIVDNRWYMHGRRPFSGLRNMYTRMTQ